MSTVIRRFETVERILEDFAALFKEGKTFTDRDYARPSPRCRDRIFPARLLHEGALTPFRQETSRAQTATSAVHRSDSREDGRFGIVVAGRASASPKTRSYYRDGIEMGLSPWYEANDMRP